jgi:hypothetical protein
VSLTQMLEQAKKWWASASEEERERMLAEQRRSWVRGEMGMGSDRDEAERARALADEDVEKLRRLDREAAERAARGLRDLARDYRPCVQGRVWHMIKIVKEGKWVHIKHDGKTLVRMTISQWSRLLSGQEVDVTRED